MKLYTTKELAQLMGVSTKTIERYRNRGLIKPVKDMGYRQDKLYGQSAVRAIRRWQDKGGKNDPDGLLSVSQLSRELNLSRQTLYNIFNQFGITPAVKVDAVHVYYPRSLIEKIKKLRATYRKPKKEESQPHGDQ